MNSSVQIFLKLGNSQKLFNHFQKQPPEVFHKESYSQTFLIFTRKHLCWGLSFNKVAGHQACNFIKKRLQHRYCLANIGKFIRRPILKNICRQLHCWKVFCENIFQIRTQQKELLTCCVTGCTNQSGLNKNASYNKVLGEIKFLKKRLSSYTRATAIGKSFV